MVMMTLIENVIIEGKDSNGVRFMLPLTINYNPYRLKAEEAIIKNFQSNATNFEELAVEQGWRSAYWTYPMGVAL